MARDKRQWINQLDKLFEAQQKKSEKESLKAFTVDYLRNVPTDDIATKEIEDVYGQTLSAWQFLQHFKADKHNTPKIEIFNPGSKQHTWRSPYTVVMILQLDKSFLVDSIRMQLAAQQLNIHSVHSLISQSHRNAAGVLQKRALCTYEQGCPIDVKGYQTEAFMYFEIDRLAGDEAMQKLLHALLDVLADVEVVVDDLGGIRGKLSEIIADLEHNPPPLPAQEIAETKAYLSWLNDHHFTFLGYKEYQLGKRSGRTFVEHVENAELGLFKRRRQTLKDKYLDDLLPDVKDFVVAPRLLSFATSGTLSRVHRPVYPDYVAIRKFDKKGRVIGEYGFLGLYTLSVYTEKVRNIPILCNKVEEVMRRSGLYPFTNEGKDLLRVLETFPREELFQTDIDDLFSTTTAIAQIKERQQTRLFVRKDHYGKFISCLLYMPRDIYDTEIRVKIQHILCRAFKALHAEFFTYFSESVLVRTHFVLRTDPNQTLNYDLGALEKEIVKVTLSWQDELVQGLIQRYGEEQGVALAQRYRNAFSLSFRDDFTPAIGIDDVQHAESLSQSKPLAMWFYQHNEEPANHAHFALYKRHEPLPLSDIVPIFENMGLRTLSEHPYKIVDDQGGVVWKHDFNLQYNLAEQLDAGQLQTVFTSAFARVWHNSISNDSFNRLVLALGLNWREVSYLRACAHYMKQIRMGFSQTYYADTLLRHKKLALALVHYFNTKFDPSLTLTMTQRLEQLEALETAYLAMLDEVSILSEDRVLRRYLQLNKAMLRSNFFQPGSDQRYKKYFSFKFDPHQLPDIPLPRPMYEVFVYSNRVEGVHLRGGKVARGGLRWSNRVEDYRTEVLGLVKAQQVKNPVIVPVGAKGGFVAHRAQEISDRKAFLEEGITCYKIFIRGLLDITDNLQGGKVVHPAEVVRYDGEDPYLVVAADKGTASFSDIANELAGKYDFWLGDAFASGGSHGYDHKGMGITARGAWVSVQRHFRERGIDVQTTDFTVMGIGGMAGDVFGNGMLLSQHIQLVAAFDHMSVFVDPNPDPAISFKERERLFKLGQVGWDDYNAKLISTGGGVFSRSAKSIVITAQMKKRFAIRANSLTPNELINALIKAPLDLLWNGGIGTYVKASRESHEEVGDKANDSVRVNGNELRVKVIGEGGNLGMTQLGRVEFALNGGALNTDAVDNVGGVDCSDHEVNIKILLNELMAAGELTFKRRNNLLERMTEQVAELVLQNSYSQGQALSIAESVAASYMNEYQRFIAAMQASGKLNRELEFLPSDDELIVRSQQGQVLTRPELAVILAYAKSGLKEEFAATKIADDEYLLRQVTTAFPAILYKQYPEAIKTHRLRREIVATQYANEMLNHMGITFVNRLRASTAASAGQIVQAYVISRDIFKLPSLWKAVEALDNHVAANVQIEMMRQLMRMVRHGSRWLLRQRYENISTEERVQHFAPGVAQVADSMDQLLCGALAQRWKDEQARLKEMGVPNKLARQIATSYVLYFSLEIVDVATITGFSIDQAARVFFNLIESLDLYNFRKGIEKLDVKNIWHSKVRDVFRDDVDEQLRILTIAVLQFNSGSPDDPRAKVNFWLASQTRQLDRWTEIQQQLSKLEKGDISMYTVAIRELIELGRLTRSSVEEYAV